MREKKGELSVRSLSVQHGLIDVRRLLADELALYLRPLSVVRSKTEHLAYCAAVGVPTIVVTPVSNPEVIIKRLALGLNNMTRLLAASVPPLSCIVR